MGTGSPYLRDTGGVVQIHQDFSTEVKIGSMSKFMGGINSTFLAIGDANCSSCTLK